MPDQPSSSKYRSPQVEDDDDDDLDDLDDVLASFNAPAKAAGTSAPAPTVPSASQRPPVSFGSSTLSPAGGDSGDGGGDGGEGDDEDFEASLVEGMESLLRQLAGPPGVMADTKDNGPSSSKAQDKDKAKGGAGSGLSAEEEEQAWQRAVQMMLSGEGLEALGLDASGQPRAGAGSGTGAKPPSASPAAAGSGSGSGTRGGVEGAKPDFDETIRRTMESLKAPKGAGGSGSGKKDDLAELLAQLGKDPSALGGLGADGEDDDLGGILDGMMAQLMTKEILEEPMSELASKYPAYLANPPADVKAEDLAKYRQQHVLVSRIVETFSKPGYDDERDGKEIARLVGEMQDLGGPPAEIMGELPEGFDLGALGGDEGCTIM